MPGRGAAARGVVCALLVLLALGGCSWRGGSDAVSDLGATDDDGYRGAYLGPDGPAVPDVDLTDDRGDRVDLGSGRALVFFGFSRCTTVCPVVLSTVAKAVETLPATDREALRVHFVTTDPAHDTAPVLRRALDRFHPSFRGVTGPGPDVERLAEALGVGLEEGRGTVLVSVDDGRADLVWSRATTPEELAGDLRRALEEDR